MFIGEIKIHSFIIHSYLCMAGKINHTQTVDNWRISWHIS